MKQRNNDLWKSIISYTRDGSARNAMCAKIEPHHIWKDGTRRCAVVELILIRHFAQRHGFGGLVLEWLERYLSSKPHKGNLFKRRGLLILGDYEDPLEEKAKFGIIQHIGSEHARRHSLFKVWTERRSYLSVLRSGLTRCVCACMKYDGDYRIAM